VTTLYLRDDLIAATAESPQFPSPSLYPSATLYPGDQRELAAAVIQMNDDLRYDVVAALEENGGAYLEEVIPGYVTRLLALVDETGAAILHT
jgi:hypothetical protein